MKPLPFLLAFAVAAGACNDQSSSPTQTPVAASVASETPGPPRASAPIGAALVDFSYAHVPFPHAVRAFIPTGSSSRNCLVTLAESNDPNNVRSVFCGPRSQDGVDGLLLSIFFFEPASPDLVIAVTVYQEFANGYGRPVLYTGS
jgi:hypothetical protein